MKCTHFYVLKAVGSDRGSGNTIPGPSPYRKLNQIWNHSIADHII
jgi:hypothetical protein